MASSASAAEAWAASGAMWLTGPSDGAALVAPDGVIDRMRSLGEPIGIDTLSLLGERAASMGLRRNGGTSCGGSARLLHAADDWIAVNLARRDDVTSVAAWLQSDADFSELWPTIEAIVATRPVTSLLEQASLLGLPCARLAEVHDGAKWRVGEFPVQAKPFGASQRDVTQWRVVDLSSLWAGPLCGRLLADAGADVTKVESITRPDGARNGPIDFFDRLNGDKRFIAVDLTTAAGVRELRTLLAQADVVIEASRPRALRQMGIVAEQMLAATTGPTIWVSITGYGRQHERVAFGDDAAIAGGLAAIDERGEPHFVADAVADPLTGIVAADAVTQCIQSGGRSLIDVSMAAVAAFVIGRDRGAVWNGAAVDAEPPRALSA